MLVGIAAVLAGTSAEYVKALAQDCSALPIEFLGSQGGYEFRIRRIAKNHKSSPSGHIVDDRVDFDVRRGDGDCALSRFRPAGS